MTPSLRSKVFGLNAIKPYGIDMSSVVKAQSSDMYSNRKMVSKNEPDPHFLTFGPKNRREFLAFRKADAD